MRLLSPILLMGIGIGCTGPIAPESQATSSGLSGDANKSALPGASTGANPAASEVGGGSANTPPADGGADAPESVEPLGKINSKSGSLVTKGFDPKSAYGAITTLGAKKALTVTISEAPLDANAFRLIKDYECVPCSEHKCAGQSSPYESISITLMNAQVFDPVSLTMKTIDAVDADGYPVSSDYEKSSTTDTSLMVTYSDGGSKTMTGGDVVGVKVLSFRVKPTASAADFTLALKAKFFSQTAAPSQQNFASTSDDLNIEVSSTVVTQAQQPTPPTCDANEYPKPIYQ